MVHCPNGVLYNIHQTNNGSHKNLVFESPISKRFETQYTLRLSQNMLWSQKGLQFATTPAVQLYAFSVPKENHISKGAADCIGVTLINQPDVRTQFILNEKKYMRRSSCTLLFFRSWGECQADSASPTKRHITIIFGFSANTIRSRDITIVNDVDDIR